MMIDDRRMVGIDLGIASDHTVRVLDGGGGEVCRRRARPTVESLAAVEVAALAGAGAGVRLEVVIEPTGELANLHDVIDIRGDQISMLYWPEELMVVPR